MATQDGESCTITFQVGDCKAVLTHDDADDAATACKILGQLIGRAGIDGAMAIIARHVARKAAKGGAA